MVNKRTDDAAFRLGFFAVSSSELLDIFDIDTRVSHARTLAPSNVHVRGELQCGRVTVLGADTVLNVSIVMIATVMLLVDRWNLYATRRATFLSGASRVGTRCR